MAGGSEVEASLPRRVRRMTGESAARPVEVPLRRHCESRALEVAVEVVSQPENDGRLALIGAIEGKGEAELLLVKRELM